MRESDFQKSIVKTIRAVGGKTFNVHGHAMQAPGWPDLQVYHRWWTGHLELKVGKNKATPKQRKVMLDLIERGTDAYVLRWVSEGQIDLETPDGDLIGSITTPSPHLLHQIHDYCYNARPK